MPPERFSGRSVPYPVQVVDGNEQEDAGEQAGKHRHGSAAEEDREHESPQAGSRDGGNGKMLPFNPDDGRFLPENSDTSSFLFSAIHKYILIQLPLGDTCEILRSLPRHHQDRGDRRGG